MEIKINKEEENPLYNRKEVVLEIVSNISPKNDEVLKAVAEKFSIPEEQIKVKGIYGKFGTTSFEVYANIYNTVKDKEETEVTTKKERDAKKKAELDRIKAAAEEKKKAEEEKKAAEEAAKAEAEKPAEEEKTE